LRIAVVDSCFLINWSRFHQSADILRVFSKIVIPEPVLEELGDLKMISKLFNISLSKLNDLRLKAKVPLILS